MTTSEIHIPPSGPPLDDATDYLQNLNDGQLQAVEATEGPVLVLAGAGTGKTRVLISRMTHVLRQGKAWPSQILAVTFTNKAANEMKQRVEETLGHAVQGLWIGTFHSTCARILRQHAGLVGLPERFTIIDTDDQIRLMKSILKAENIDDKKDSVKTFLGQIEAWKDRAQTPKDIVVDRDHSDKLHLAHRIYQIYEDRLIALNAVDFGNLLLHVLTIFKHHPDVLTKFQQQFRYMMVDEYQDTNVAQYLWLRLLAEGTRNICCVGDDDQSIYGWRGAEVGNILRFEKDFPGAVIVRLEQNYRSTEHILNAASHLIAHNKQRHGKTLWTEKNGGDKIRIKNTWDGKEEARWVGEEIEDFHRQKIDLKNIAILIRAGFQTRAFEECFITMGIPYRIIGGFRFYERQEIRDAIAYLRIVAQGHDSLAFERIVNVPRRGIGNSTLQLIHTYARAEGIALLDSAKCLLETDELSGKAKKSLDVLMADIVRWRSMIPQLPANELAKMVLDESGYTHMWQKDTGADAPGRLENLKELVSALGEFPDIYAFLEHVSLVMEHNQNRHDDAVTIMTMHGSKGLEFDYVFLAGWEDGVFPSNPSRSHGFCVEEERRLAYVGLTRAKKRAYISFAVNRHFYGQWTSNPPSRFIKELPEESVTWLPGAFQRAKTSHFSQPRSQSAIPKVQPVPQNVKKDGFYPGLRVFHLKFGYGKVQEVEGNRLTIRFDHTGIKRVLDNFVKKA